MLKLEIFFFKIFLNNLFKKYKISKHPLAKSIKKKKGNRGHKGPSSFTGMMTPPHRQTLGVESQNLLRNCIQLIKSSVWKLGWNYIFINFNFFY